MSANIAPLAIMVQAFPNIPEEEALELINRGNVRVYPPRTVLCHEDAFESTFYIILEGQVHVTKILSHDQVRLLKTLEAGDFFGEMAIIHDAPRAATVTTTIQTTVLEIRKDSFKKLLRTSASLSLAMVHEVSRRLRENDAMAIEDLRLKAGELAFAYQQLAEQEFAKRQFLTTIAHELRTPLTAANGFIHMIQSGMIKGDGLHSTEQQAALDSVARNIQQIISLVNDLLFLQEMDLILPHFQAVNVGEILSSVVDTYREKAIANQVELRLAIDQDVPLIPGDKKTLERAISAVLDNAIKFSPNGGVVNVQIRYEDSRVAIVCQDEGVGIPKDLLPRIFDRFFHIDQIEGYLFRGIGLGLSIARQVIEQHGGTIEVESELGRGTKLTITLNQS